MSVESAPSSGGTAVIAFPAEPDVLNPLIRGSAYTGQILSLLNDQLLEMEEDFTWSPRIATDWDLAPDGMSLTYHLRPWIWADGVPLTASDVAASFRLFISPAVASTRRGAFNGITAAIAVDSSMVRYEFSAPIPDPLARTAHAILPLHITRELDPAEVRSWPLNEKPLASGAFLLEKWVHNQSLVLVRNPDYPGQPARLDRVVFQIIPDETARVLALETGAVDFMEELPVQAARRLSREERFMIHRVSGRLFAYLSWNFRNPLFADPRVRKAISLAIDRQRMVDSLLEGYAAPAASLMPPVLWAHNPAVEVDSFDPQRARQLLAEAGWVATDGKGILQKDGREFSFEILTRQGDPVRENGAVIIRENLRQIGILARPRALEHATSLQMMRQGDFDSYLGLFQANLFGDPSSLVHSKATDRYNYGHYASAEVDSLIDLALSLRDRSEAKAVWDRLQVVLAEDLPMAFLYYPDTIIGVSRRLRGVRPHVLSPFNNLSEWWIAPADRKYAAPGT